MEPLDLLPDGYKLTVGSHKVQILKYLSAGGFAHIYKVKIDPVEDNNEIACLKRVLVPDKRGLDQLRKEVDVMKKLRLCRNVVRYYDSHAERLDNGTYQVLVLMELCPNKSLLDYMNAKIKTKLTEAEILTIMFDICIGVFEMHRKRMIHRDIKIENVLIDANNRFKLCDFGSTSPPIPPPKNQQEFQALTHDILYQTTPQYRSPEMIDLYRNLPIDEKADIWALGCFLYKLCYYTTPFEANGDIAILHASFQFPPSPIYSGDLKNLIIILLQENPYFRPNIVQVLKLVCKMLNVDFKTIGVEDIYKLGSYNFLALYQYQQQKQQEMVKQTYYQQQQQQQQQQQPPASHSHSPQPGAQPVAQPPAQLVAQPASQSASSHKLDQTLPENAARLSKTPISQQSTKPSSISGAPEMADDELESDLDETFGDLGDLDNVEARYPSLENIVAEPDTKSDHSGNTAATTVTTSTAKVQMQQKPSQTNIPTSSYPQIPYPVQPPVLSPENLKELTPEQLQQYQYQHQVFQYQMNQWHFYQQQQQYHQQYQQQQQQPLHNQNRPSSIMQRSGSQYEKKEAWEINETKMDQQAEKLVDDIFGSKSRSPDGLQVQQKTSQSVKSVKSESAARYSSDVEDDVEGYFDTGKRLTKSNNSSTVNIDVKEEPNSKGSEDTYAEVSKIPTALELLDGDIDNSGKKITEHQAEEIEEKEQQQEKQEDLIQELQEKESDVKSPEVQTNVKPVVNPEKEIPIQTEIKDQKTHTESGQNIKSDRASIGIQNNRPRIGSSQPSGHITTNNIATSRPNVSINTNSQVSVPLSLSPEIPFTSPVMQPNQAFKNNNPFPVEEAEKSNLEKPEKKSSNPWGDYRTDASKGRSSLNIDEEQMHHQGTRNPSVEETTVNLIDMEIGLKSASSSSLKLNDEALQSLIDLDFEDNNSSSSSSNNNTNNNTIIKSNKPHFKKKSLTNPSDFRVTEEIVDWASDDENPDNNSQMNRLSIRNSLRKLSRKSGEHKRSDSSSGKRLSRLIN